MGPLRGDGGRLQQDIDAAVGDLLRRFLGELFRLLDQLHGRLTLLSLGVDGFLGHGKADLVAYLRLLKIGRGFY